MAAKAIKLGMLGLLMGMVVGAFIVIACGFAFRNGSLYLPPALLAATGSEAGALLAQMLLSGLYGIVPMAGVVIYDIDSWGLLKQAIVHYASYTAAFLLIGSFVGWVEGPAEMGLMAGIFLVCHCIIWFIMYSRYKAETKELNELLREAKQNA